MTIKQALIATISIPGIDGNLVDKALVDNDLTGDSTYTKSDKSKVEVAAISALLSALHLASLSEGGFSVSFNFEAAKENLVRLANENTDASIAQQVLKIYGPKNAIRTVSRW